MNKSGRVSDGRETVSAPGPKDRAAINLESTVSSTGFQACGEKGAGPDSCRDETGLNEAGTKPCTDLYTF